MSAAQAEPSGVAGGRRRSLHDRKDRNGGALSMVRGREDVVPAVRAAMVAAAAGRNGDIGMVEVGLPASAKKPSVTLTLSNVLVCDGVPEWDGDADSSASCVVLAVRADGRRATFDDVSGWSDLTGRVIEFMRGWPEKTAGALERARSSAREVDRLRGLLDRARAAQRRTAREAVGSGASVYRVAKTMGRSETAVKSWASTPSRKA